MKKFISRYSLILLCISSQACGNDLAVERTGATTDYYRNEIVTFKIRNTHRNSVDVFYFAEVWREGKWRIWGFGSVSGRPSELAETFVIPEGKEINVNFNLSNAPPPSIPDDIIVNCNAKAKFRIHVVAKNSGKKFDYFSDQFFIYGNKSITNGVISNISSTCHE